MTIQPKISRSPKSVLGGPLYIRLKTDEMARVEHHAATENRSRANFLRMVTLLGLDAYERDLATHLALTTHLS